MTEGRGNRDSTNSAYENAKASACVCTGNDVIYLVIFRAALVYTSILMLLKFNQSREHRYVQLGDAFHDDSGRPRQRAAAMVVLL